jgi:methionine-rich copper-binding protein CopC
MKTLLALALALACAMIGPAAAMVVMDSHPAASAVMDGAATQFFVRFDEPVDHARSTLAIERDGQVIRALRPRLNSQPNVLYAEGVRLEPGMYVLRWTSHAMRGGGTESGTIPFTVAPPSAVRR